jgi:hypothetical protein
MIKDLFEILRQSQADCTSKIQHVFIVSERLEATATFFIGFVKEADVGQRLQ